MRSEHYQWVSPWVVHYKTQTTHTTTKPMLPQLIDQIYSNQLIELIENNDLLAESQY